MSSDVNIQLRGVHLHFMINTTNTSFNLEQIQFAIWTNASVSSYVNSQLGGVHLHFMINTTNTSFNLKQIQFAIWTNTSVSSYVNSQLGAVVHVHFMINATVVFVCNCKIVTIVKLNCLNCKMYLFIFQNVFAFF